MFSSLDPNLLPKNSEKPQPENIRFKELSSANTKMTANTPNARLDNNVIIHQGIIICSTYIDNGKKSSTKIKISPDFPVAGNTNFVVALVEVVVAAEAILLAVLFVEVEGVVPPKIKVTVYFSPICVFIKVP